jgi:anti-anti-sigma regulatory factor
MTIKIVRDPDTRTTVIHLIGRVEAVHVHALRAEIDACAGTVVVLDLDDVTVVDVDVVQFLNACEAQGVALRCCPPYVREWMSRETM